MFDRIKESIEKFSRRSDVDEEAVEELVKEIQRDLIEADVDVKMVSDISDNIRDDALKDERPSGVTLKEHVIETVYNELEDLLGKEADIRKEPHTIMLVGLYGAGKTTTAAKLADYYRKRELKPGLIAADTDRPAAHDQLKQLSEQVDSRFYGEPETEDPSKIVKNGLEEVDSEVTIIDTAGRDSLKKELKDEIKSVKEAADPDEIYLVIPADIGQSAKEQASEFEDAVGITGVIVTKTDSTAKGGGAVVACRTADTQVKFVGNGERPKDLERFDPVKYVSRIIGQPDLNTLLEKVEEMEADPEDLLEGEFTMRDFEEQLQSVTDTGMMEEMMQQLPISSSKVPDNISQITDEKVNVYQTIINSMTEEEVRDPSLMDRSRVERVAQGSATSPEEVRELLKHYRQTKNMVDKFDKKSMERGQIGNLLNQFR